MLPFFMNMKHLVELRGIYYDEPTPCNPPETLYPPPPDSPPAVRTVKLVSTAGRPVPFSEYPTEIPRPSSQR